MATINDQGIIITMLANGGVFEGDPVPVYIYKYVSTLAKRKTYSVMYNNTPLNPSEYVIDPVLLMKNGVLTPEGQKMLDALKKETPDDLPIGSSGEEAEDY